jgi:hypothetical protein
MDIVFSMIAFFALVASWFVLPSAPPARAIPKPVPSEALAPAA